MPVIGVGRDKLFEALGKTYSKHIPLNVTVLLRMFILESGAKQEGIVFGQRQEEVALYLKAAELGRAVLIYQIYKLGICHVFSISSEYGPLAG